MSLQSRLAALITAVGADIKELQNFTTTGLRQNRPVSGTRVGQRYFANDQFAEYVWLGAGGGGWVRTSTPAGVEADFAGVIARLPDGWDLLFGQTVSRSGVYADLFAALGTTYGAGNGTTTFTLPDSRGRVAVGKDTMGGTAANRLVAASTETATGGAETVAHTHTVKSDVGYRTSDGMSGILSPFGANDDSAVDGATVARDFLGIGFPAAAVSITRRKTTTSGASDTNNTQPWRSAQRIVKL